MKLKFAVSRLPTRVASIGGSTRNWGEALLVGGADGKLFQKCAPLRHRLIRVIDREHDAVDATQFKKEAKEGCRENEARESVMEIFAQVRGDGALQLGHCRNHDVDALKHARQAFAHVADHDL